LVHTSSLQYIIKVGKNFAQPGYPAGEDGRWFEPGGGRG
jgi:hypothetical protein